MPIQHMRDNFQGMPLSIHAHTACGSRGQEVDPSHCSNGPSSLMSPFKWPCWKGEPGVTFSGKLILSSLSLPKLTWRPVWDLKVEQQHRNNA